MDYEGLLKQYRKKPLAEPESLSHRLNLGREEIIKIIPHRDPFLLLDRITGIDLSEELIIGNRNLRAADPVFRGHFPEYPVYPGALEVEMIGQLGLCLYYFLENQTTTIDEQARPVAVRATRILGACFLEPLLPRTDVVLIARKLDYDGFFASMIGQAVAHGKVCCVTIGEVCFLE